MQHAALAHLQPGHKIYFRRLILCQGHKYIKSWLTPRHTYATCCAGTTTFAYVLTDGGQLYAAADVVITVVPSGNAPTPASPSNRSNACFARPGASCAAQAPAADAGRVAIAMGVPLGAMAAAVALAALFDRWRLALRGGRQYRTSLQHQAPSATAQMGRPSPGTPTFHMPLPPSPWGQPPPVSLPVSPVQSHAGPSPRASAGYWAQQCDVQAPAILCPSPQGLPGICRFKPAGF